MLSDVQLVQACMEGDETAWALLIRRYQRLIYSVSGAICRKPEDAADVFQQVCLEWYRVLGQLRDVQSLPAWLITITRRLAYRNLSASRNTELSDQFDGLIERRIRNIELEHTIETLMERMPDRCRRLLTLLYLDVEEPSYIEVAQAMNMPVSSVGPTRARCLSKLRKLLDEC